MQRAQVVPLDLRGPFMLDGVDFNPKSVEGLVLQQIRRIKHSRFQEGVAESRGFQRQAARAPRFAVCRGTDKGLCHYAQGQRDTCTP